MQHGDISPATGTINLAYNLLTMLWGAEQTMSFRSVWAKRTKGSAAHRGSFQGGFSRATVPKLH